MENTPVLSRARARLLGLLGPQPATLAELSARTGLHPNTLRGHLDGLVAGGQVTRVALPRSGRGRPAWGYLARETEYPALAEALATGLETAPTGAGPEVVAGHGGRAWGVRLRQQLDPDGQSEPETLLLRSLQHTGFDPEPGKRTIRLTACPLLSVARRHSAVVCGVHQGLIDGVLGGPGARLEPFAEPRACLVRLT